MIKQKRWKLLNLTVFEKINYLLLQVCVPKTILSLGMKWFNNFLWE